MSWRYNPVNMPAEPADLRELQAEIETFLRAVEHPIVVEDEVELFDLTAAAWRLSVEFGKLIFEAWNPERSIARRVEEVAYRDGKRLGLFVWKPGARRTSTLELRPLARAARPAGTRDRPRTRGELIALLNREFPGWRFERVSQRSDRENSLSAWYTRGWARRGTTGWAFLGLGEGEAPAAADSVLAFGLIWLDWLRTHALRDRVTVPGLKLFLPQSAVETTAHRAAWLNSRAVQLAIFAWGDGGIRPVDLKDFGNVETSLVTRRQGLALVERHRDLLDRWTADLGGEFESAPDPSASFVALKVRGLEVARVEGLLAPRLSWGPAGRARPLREEDEAEFREFLKSVLALRAHGSPDPSHEYFRFHSERWLESLLVREITLIDPALLPECVYPQVPAFAGTERGVIDILSATRAGRLAVIELKLEEEINLPFQGLDYWLRVKWLAERNQFTNAGYFAGVEISPAPPLLYLVSPAFRFHSTTPTLLRYLHPSLTVVQVGLSARWRKEIRVLFRRELSATGGLRMTPTLS